MATGRTYNGPSGGSWFTGPWSPAGTPVIGDIAAISPTGTNTFTVNFDVAYSGTGLAVLFIDPNSTGSALLSQSISTSVMIANSEIVGDFNDFAAGVYTQSAGVNSVGLNMIVGNSAGGVGIYNLSGGSHSAPNLYVGSAAASVGTYNLSANGNLSVTNTESIGFSGTGVFNHSGGTHTVNTLTLGANSNGTNPASLGTYNLSNGASLVVGGLTVGKAGVGVFNQTGGSNNAEVINIGFVTNGVGTYNFSDGILTTTLLERIGYVGTGVFNQSGGAHIANDIFLGFITNTSFGTYNLSKGSLAVTFEEALGLNGSATFNQTGGSNTASILALGAAVNGTYNLGNSSTLSTGTTQIGSGGINVFNQTGGTHTTSTLFVGLGDVNTFPIGTGTYNMSNGASLTAASEVVGDAGIGVFNQTGGVHSITGSLTLALPGGTSSGAVNLSGGTLTANSVLLNAGGVINVTGGSFRTNSFYQPAGSVGGTGTIQVQTLFSYTNGTFNARLRTQGAMQWTGTFTAGNGVENDGTIVLGSGQTLVANGAGLDNEGSFTVGAGANVILSTTAVNVNNNNFTLAPGAGLPLGGAALLNGGVFNVGGNLLSGPGSFTNSASGTLAGPGSVALAFTNSGVVAIQGGALSVTQPWSNNGVVQLSGPTNSLLGATLKNTGSVQGVGSVGSPLINTGTVEPLGGTLVLSGAVTNSASGLLRATAGNKLLVTQGLDVNSGIINLLGGTFDNNAHPLTNTGTVTGFGTLSTGGLTNAPGQTITFTGGLTTVNGAVTNSAGATLRASFNPVLFTGPVVNNGVIKVSGSPTNTVTFASTYSGSGQYLSDPADNYFVDVNVSSGGQISGSVGDRFFVNGAYVNASGATYVNAGGSFAGQDVVNHGAFIQSAGFATANNFSGTGALTVGGAGTALVSLASIQQNAVTVNNNAQLVLRPGTTRLTNTIGTLSMPGSTSATFDIGSHDVILNGTYASVNGLIKQAAGTINNGSNGLNPWNGVGGITSSLAKADAANGNPLQRAVGVRDNADYIASGNSGKAVATGKVLVSYAAYGDANLDNTVDIADLSIWNNNFALGNHWGQGDFNYDGVVDIADLSIWNNNFAGKVSPTAPLATPPRTFTPTPRSGRAAGPLSLASPIAPTTPPTNTLELDIDATTGDATINSGGVSIAAVEIDSAAKDLITANWKSFKNVYHVSGWSFTKGVPNTAVVAEFTSDASSTGTPIALAQGSLTDYGNIVPVGFSNQNDLTFKYNIVLDAAGNTQSKIGNVVITGAVPEPTSLGLVALAGAGLLMRRRKRAHLA